MQKVHRFFFAFLIAMFFSLSLSGCYDSTEIDEEVYALAVGVDKGVSNIIRVTIQYATYKDGGGGQKSGGGGNGESAGGGKEEESGEVDGTVVATVEAPSLLEAINMLNLSSNRQISLFHTKMLVFSEDYAREGVMRYVEPLARYRQVRDSMRVVVCQGTAEEFIKKGSDYVGANMSKGMELSFYQSQNTGYFPDVFFHDFYASVLSPYGQSTAIYAGVNDFKQLEVPTNRELKLVTDLDMKPGQIPRKGGSKSEFFGTAVFDGDKMVGYLLQNETRFYLIATGKFQWGTFTFKDPQSPNYAFLLEITNSRKPEVEFRFEEGVPVIDLKIGLEAELVSSQSRINYEDLDRIAELETEVEKYFCDGIKRTIDKTQQEWNSDIFFFGKKAAAQFRTIQEMESYNWLQHYHQAEVNVDVDVKIRRSGFLFKAMPIQSTSAGQKGRE